MGEIESENISRELDETLVDVMRERKQSGQSLARMLSRIKQTKAYRDLEYRSFREYLEARGISQGQGYSLARAYEVLTGLGLREQDWEGVKLSKLFCCIGVLSRDNAGKILAQARRLARRDFEDYIRDLRGKRPSVARGCYKLTPCHPQGPMRRLRSVRGEIYETGSGEKILLVP